MQQNNLPLMGAVRFYNTIQYNFLCNFFCTTVMRIEKKMFNCYENNVKSNPKHKDPKNRLNFIMQNK